MNADMKRCPRCGLRSRLSDAFAPVGGLFGRKTAVCPMCRARQKNRLTAFTSAAFGVGWGVALTLLAFRHSADGIGAGWFWLVGIGFVAVPPVMTVIHESLHAVAGRLGGARLFEVRVGSGEPRWSVIRSGVRWTLGRRVLQGGYCAAVFPDARRALPIALFVSAPLLFHLALAAVLIPQTSFVTNETGILAGLIDIVCGYNMWLALINLWPHDTAQGPMRLPSDGKTLLRIATKPDFLADYRDNAPVTSCLFAALNGDKESAVRYAAEAVKQQSDRPRALASVVAALHLAEQHEQVVETANDALGPFDFADLDEEEREALYLGAPPMVVIFEVLYADSLCRLDRADEALVFAAERRRDLPEGPMQAIWMNNEAYYMVRYRPTPARIAEALELARHASECLPWVGYVRGTLGITLVENGRPRKGLEVLDSADRYGNDPMSAAIRHAYRALANAQLGHGRRAQRHLQLARLHPVETELLDTIAKRVEATVTG